MRACLELEGAGGGALSGVVQKYSRARGADTAYNTELSEVTLAVEREGCGGGGPVRETPPLGL